MKYLIFLFLFSGFIQITFGQTKKKNTNKKKVGYEIQGDFNGDGIIETAKLVKSKKGYGNPVEDGIADEYEIQFSGNSLPSINIGCCEAKLINEGNLTSNKKDVISIFQAPMNGCTYLLQTYEYTKTGWTLFLDSLLITTACEEISDNHLQNRIIKENNSIYYYLTDPNTGKKIKHKVKNKN